MQLRSRLSVGLFVTILVLLIAWGFRPPAVFVDAATTNRSAMLVTVEEEGKTRVIDRYVISAPVAGYSQRIELNVGDAIEKNQILLKLEPLPSAVLDPRSLAEARARVEVARNALNAARENAGAAAAEADLSNKELKRIQRLVEINHASQDQLDRAQAEARRAAAVLRSAKFAVEVADHELEAATTALHYSAAQGNSLSVEQVPITSPIKGRVLKIYRESEGVVTAGQPLIEVGNPRSLEVEVEVLSMDAVRIRPGADVVFKRWGGEQPLIGQVRLVEPVGFTKISALGVEEQRVLVIADITSPPEQWQLLGDGYRVEASFILWRDQEVLQIPASALFHHNGNWAVFVVNDGRAERRMVKIGQRNGLVAQVLEGLNEGEQVVTHPDDEIEDGSRVHPR